MQNMIGHHAQALAMTALVPGRTTREDIRLVAQRIEVSQRDEIRLMQRWLASHHEAVPSVDSSASAGQAMPHEHAGMNMPGMSTSGALMPGMLTAEEMEQLAKATGAEFDRLFLQFMIRHHEGALTMVGQLFGTPGAGQNTDIFRVASDVEADQRAEIARMRALLDKLPAAR
jgi:uncharacterized protein (DUF305 family)